MAAISISAAVREISACPVMLNAWPMAASDRLAAQPEQRVEVHREHDDPRWSPTTANLASALPSSTQLRVESMRPRPVTGLRRSNLRHHRLAAECPAAQRQGRAERRQQGQAQVPAQPQAAHCAAALPRIGSIVDASMVCSAESCRPGASARRGARPPCSPSSLQSDARGEHDGRSRQIA